MDLGRIDIALASDGGYFAGLFVAACSIAKHASRGRELRFDVLDGGICSEDWTLLEENVRRLHPESAFNRIAVDESLFAGFPEWHGNKMAYARLLLPEILSDADWCIYCDVDFLWGRDVAELWQMRDARCAMVAVADGAPATMAEEGAWFAAHGYEFDPGKYFCSGLCFMNLRMFRDESLTRRVLELLERHPDFLHPDQNALNIATWGRTLLVPRCWQTFHQDVTAEAVESGVVIHYAGAVPWKRLERKVHFLGDVMLLWHRMNAEARGISLWRGLRMFFSPWHILWHRGIRDAFFALDSLHLLGWLRLLLAETGHAGAWENMRRCSARVPMPGPTGGKSVKDAD